ncbi:unnamed protein product [Protopolystoma xenopodis]|uniref:Uncharacterized protein n=1 Tax=Protopolystoma xenopodis TaxID=117903 RepID=A0A448WUR6_9PLAT|nr:unnamed protein product [Protopolystoma xenopodis]
MTNHILPIVSNSRAYKYAIQACTDSSFKSIDALIGEDASIRTPLSHLLWKEGDSNNNLVYSRPVKAGTVCGLEELNSMPVGKVGRSLIAGSAPATRANRSISSSSNSTKSSALSTPLINHSTVSISSKGIGGTTAPMMNGTNVNSPVRSPASKASGVRRIYSQITDPKSMLKLPPKYWSIHSRMSKKQEASASRKTTNGDNDCQEQASLASKK